MIGHFPQFGSYLSEKKVIGSSRIFLSQMDKEVPVKFYPRIWSSDPPRVQIQTPDTLVEVCPDPSRIQIQTPDTLDEVFPDPSIVQV